MGQKIRISGLVRLADVVRRELAGPLSADRRERMRRHVERELLNVEQMLREARSRAERLPAPSRRAIEFLRSIDWAKLPAAGDVQPSSAAPAAQRMTWPGLTQFVERLMDQLSQAPPGGQLEPVRQSAERMSRRMEGTIKRRNVSADELSPGPRGLRGWLAFLARPEGIAMYAAAINAARAAVAPAVQRLAKFAPPLRIHFRPMRGTYKLRGGKHGSVLSLPTPMIAFDPYDFAIVASAIENARSDARQRVLDRMTAEGFQSVQAELEALSGVPRRTRGAFHDLDESFDRVNAQYFGGAIGRPRLTWSRSFTGRKFGHYDWIRDTVMVSRTLDAPDVPAFAVDHIVYHELLHKRHGLRWVNGRGYAHTPQFQREDRRFERYEEADAILRRLARGP